MDKNLNKIIEEFKILTQKPCYQVELVNGEPLIFDDKIGGKPYLPIGEQYPLDKNGNPMALLLQVNLRNVKDLRGFPREGVLEIFVSSNAGKYPLEYAFKLFKNDLEFQTQLPDVNLNKFFFKNSHRIYLKKSIAHMPVSNYRFYFQVSRAIEKALGEKVYSGKVYQYLEQFDDWQDEFEKQCNYPKITVGGYADFVQEDPREKGGSKLFDCVFKLDSNYDYNIFEIGDSGILFALTEGSRFMVGDFSNSIVDFDCC